MPTLALPKAESPAGSRWPGLPSWVVSIGLHAGLLVLLGFTLQREPRGASEEPGREVGVAIKRIADDGEQYFETANPTRQATHATDATAAGNANPSQVVGDQSPVNVAASLPQGKPLVGIGASGNPATGASGLTQGGGDNGLGKLTRAGVTKVPFFGIVGEGNKFVYVLDRSASMGNERYSPLLAAKAQLKKSLEQLGKQNQFQIIFFNQEPKMFALGGLPAAGTSQRMAFGDSQSIQQAHRFIDGVLADGGTEYVPAFEMALGMGPDVVFFLTDAGTPLSEGQIQRITQRNRSHASINIVEFGEGRPLSGDNSMARLAQLNQGRYLYLDIATGLDK